MDLKYWLAKNVFKSKLYVFHHDDNGLMIRVKSILNYIIIRFIGVALLLIFVPFWIIKVYQAIVFDTIKPILVAIIKMGGNEDYLPLINVYVFQSLIFIVLIVIGASIVIDAEEIEDKFCRTKYYTNLKTNEL